MSETKVTICRLCLTVLEDEVHFATDLQMEMLQIILPTLNMNISQFVVMCSKCVKDLEQNFSFKSAFLEIEDTIHGYRENEEQVDLEKIMGVADMPLYTLNKGKICRTCLQLVENDFYKWLCEENSSLVDMLQKCLPEIDINLTKQAVVCQNCIAVLGKCIGFIEVCLKNEDKIKTYLEISNQCGDVNLSDVVRYFWAKEGDSILKTELIKDEDMDPVPISEPIKENVNNNLVGIPNDNSNRETDVYIISDDEDVTEIFTKSIDQVIPPTVTSSTSRNGESDGLGIDCENNVKERRQSYLSAVKNLSNNTVEDDAPEGLSDSGSEYVISEVEVSSSDDDVISVSSSVNRRSKRVKPNSTIQKVVNLDGLKKPTSAKSHKSTNRQKKAKVKNKKVVNQQRKSINSQNEANIIDRNVVKVHKCSYCFQETLHKKTFDKHFDQHKNHTIERDSFPKTSTDIIFSCLLCVFQTQFKQTIDEHIMQLHVRPTPCSFKCTVCSENYPRIELVTCHPNLAPLAIYKCPYCSFLYDKKSKICSHMARLVDRNFSKEFYCRICFESFRKKELLLMHMSNHKQAEEIIYYRCVKCIYQSKSNMFVREHVKKAHRAARQMDMSGTVYSSKEECPICNISLKNAPSKS